LRSSVGALVFVACLIATPRADAWDRPTEVVQGTARVLEKGEMIIGILTPLGYGLGERVTIFTHPILDLLLTPNLWLRVDLWNDERWAIALEAGYQQSFLSVAAEDVEGAAAEYPGYLQGGFATSLAAGIFQITLATGYEGRFSGKDDLSDVFLYYRVGLDLLAGERSLVMVRVVGDMGVSPFRLEIPAVTLLYAHEFGRLRLGAGVVAGSFPIKGLPDEFDEWPVYPWLDVWWRF
jgi:hypothetical protein